MLALNLVNSEAAIYPDSGIACGWLVVIFTLHMFMLNSKTKKVENSQNMQSPTQQPIANWENGRAMLTSLIYDRK